MHVDGFRRQLERVAAAAHRDEVGRAQRAAQLRREPLETVAHRRRRILAPQRVDDLFGRDHPAHVQRQHGEERPQLRAGDHDVAARRRRAPRAHRATRRAWRRRYFQSSQLHPDDLVTLAAARLTRAAASTIAGAGLLDGGREQDDHLVVGPEGGEVLERLGRSHGGPNAAQLGGARRAVVGGGTCDQHVPLR